MVVEQIVVGPIQANCYIVGDRETGEAAVIDPGAEGRLIMEAVNRGPWKVVAIINTHAHFDHTSANAAVKKATGAPIILPEKDAPYIREAHLAARIYGIAADASPEPDRLVREGDTVSVGSHTLSMLSTPGHTPGGATFVGPSEIFPGDVLFAGSIGRTDLPGGDYSTLIMSIREKILTLPDETVVYPGHGPATTVGRERNLNPFLAE